MTAGEKLAALRAEKELSVRAVAAELGMAPSTYSRMENGGKISDEAAGMLAEFYGVDKAALMDDVESVPGNAAAADKPAGKPMNADEPAGKPETAGKAAKKAAPKKDSKKGSPAAKKADKAGSKAKATAKAGPKQPKAAKKPEAPAHMPNIELQYMGKAVTYSEIVEKARKASGAKGELNIYIKPEENRVYYVAGSEVGSFEI